MTNGVKTYEQGYIDGLGMARQMAQRFVVEGDVGPRQVLDALVMHIDEAIAMHIERAHERDRDLLDLLWSEQVDRDDDIEDGKSTEMTAR